MSRQKGTPKTGGRTKGTPNKTTQNVKQWIEKIIDKNRKQVERDLKSVEPQERLKIIEKLLQYVVPKQQAQSVDVDFSSLNDAQLESIVTEITKDLK